MTSTLDAHTQLLQVALAQWAELRMSLTGKFTWVIGLSFVLLFVLASSRTNVRNFERVQTSIEEIYADRLLVKGLIFDLASLLHRKQIAVITGDGEFFEQDNDSLNEQLADKLHAFRATRLTRREEETLDRFTVAINKLEASERNLGLANKLDLTPDEANQLREQFAYLQQHLKALSEIQLAEGQKKLNVSDGAVNSMNVLATIEFYLMLFFGVAMLVVIFVVPGVRETRS